MRMVFLAFVFLLCALLFCSIAHGLNEDNVFYGIKVVNSSAWAAGTDKAISHEYGLLLLPMLERYKFEKRQLKFLEIGLGCDMWYGPGASVKLWKDLFKGKDVEIWEAEYNATCVENAKSKGQLPGINVVTGDQADPLVLQSWIEQSKGKFDVIIDDGGHTNVMILNTLAALWPELNPGGWYFVEDIHVSYMPHYLVDGFPATTMVFQSWVEALNMQPFPVSHHHRHHIGRYPLPHKMDMILCQREACALHKEEASGL